MFSFRQQYMQIDFLRLFRLCRSLGVAKRKRKMPIEYNTDNKASAASRRLLKSLLEKHLFVGWCVSTQYENLRVQIPTEIRQIFRAINSVRYDNSLRNICGDEIDAAIDKYNLLADGIPYIRPYLPYEIKVSALNRSQLVGRYRPTEKFYECALACIEFKELWDANIQALRDFYYFFQTKRDEINANQRRQGEERNREEAEARRVVAQEIERRRIAEVAETAEANRIEEERRAAVAAQVSAEAERRRESAQNRFEQALSRFRENRSAGDGGV